MQLDLKQVRRLIISHLIRKANVRNNFSGKTFRRLGQGGARSAPPCSANLGAQRRKIRIGLREFGECRLKSARGFQKSAGVVQMPQLRFITSEVEMENRLPRVQTHAPHKNLSRRLDASMPPLITTGTPTSPTLMIAENAGGWIVDDAR